MKQWKLLLAALVIGGIIMPHGMADFGVYAPKETTYNLADLADLAARLGSIVEYDRRGDVAYLDDFEGAVPKFTSLAPAGCGGQLDTEAIFGGSQAVKLFTAGVEDTYGIAVFRIAPLAKGRHGAKISSNLYGFSAHDLEFDITMRFDDVDGTRQAGVRLNLYNDTIEYFSAPDTWVPFATLRSLLTVYKQHFHNIKLVVDWTTNKYVRLLIDTIEFDMSAYEFYVLAGARSEYTVTSFTVRDREGYAIEAWIDNFVYTVNEP